MSVFQAPRESSETTPVTPRQMLICDALEQFNRRLRAASGSREVASTIVKLTKGEMPLASTSMLRAVMTPEEREVFDQLPVDPNIDNAMRVSMLQQINRLPSRTELPRLIEGRLALIDRGYERAGASGTRGPATRNALLKHVSPIDVERLHYFDRLIDQRPVYALDADGRRLYPNDLVASIDGRNLDMRVIDIRTMDTSKSTGPRSSRLKPGLHDEVTVEDVFKKFPKYWGEELRIAPSR